MFNVQNSPKPAPGQPQLISFDDANTMFHEFGHALHGMLSKQTYPSIAGANTARDFVEFPSQFNENWMTDPKVFANFAKHYQTGKPMPQALVDKVQAASRFNQGYGLGELLTAAMLDQKWHALSADAGAQTVDGFEGQALSSLGLETATVPPRYRTSYFRHIWGGGYAAGYYAYLWTEMLHHDAYQWFVANGGMTRANGDRFRAMVLSQGNSQDYALDVPRLRRARSQHRTDAESARVEVGARACFLSFRRGGPPAQRGVEWHRQVLQASLNPPSGQR